MSQKSLAAMWLILERMKDTSRLSYWEHVIIPLNKLQMSEKKNGRLSYSKEDQIFKCYNGCSKSFFTKRGWKERDTVNLSIYVTFHSTMPISHLHTVTCKCQVIIYACNIQYIKIKEQKHAWSFLIHEGAEHANTPWLVVRAQMHRPQTKHLHIFLMIHASACVQMFVLLCTYILIWFQALDSILYLPFVLKIYCISFIVLIF